MRALLFAFAFAIALTTGCTHALEVHNLERYQEPTRLEPAPVRTRVAVRPYAGPIDALFWFEALLWQLGRSPVVEEIRTDYVESPDDTYLPDLILSLDHRLDYRSSGWNFLINWPGFVVFLPAWLGYGYHAEVETRVRIEDSEGAASELAIAASYDLRHADMDRTVWAGLGWLGLYGATALVGGVYDAIVFDEGIIGGFQVRVRENYSAYVANRIVDKIVALDPGRQRSTGSCFAVDRNGTLLTAHHLVADAKAIRVLLPSGEWARAELSAALEAEDLAVLRLARATRGFVLVAGSNAARTTRSVLTLAHPGRVGAGAESPLIVAEIRTASGPLSAPTLELSAALDPAFAGSPLLNEAGQAIGVVVSPALAHQPARAIGIDAVRPLVDSLREGAETGRRDLSVRRARSALCYVEATR